MLLLDVPADFFHQICLFSPFCQIEGKHGPHRHLRNPYVWRCYSPENDVPPPLLKLKVTKTQMQIKHWKHTLKNAHCACNPILSNNSNFGTKKQSSNFWILATIEQIFRFSRQISKRKFLNFSFSASNIWIFPPEFRVKILEFQYFEFKYLNFPFKNRSKNSLKFQYF